MYGSSFNAVLDAILSHVNELKLFDILMMQVGVNQLAMLA
jgi:hypothetical protein